MKKRLEFLMRFRPTWKNPRRWRGSRSRLRQIEFPFLERSSQLERSFKRAIVGFTVVVIAAVLLGLPAGRYAVGLAGSKLARAGLRLTGRSPAREVIDADWKRKREFDVETGLTKYRATFATMDPAVQDLFRLGGLDPDKVVLRWGNFDRTLLLPSTVFEPEQTGRSYRMKPLTKSVWVRNLKSIQGLPSFFLMTESNGLEKALRSASSAIIEGSAQSTNSWGLRGPEFDRSAPLRGIVLGDSFMQGIFIPDDATPPSLLRRDLEARLNIDVQVLNTGHIGYSPEQCYFTLREFADRVAPRFVVLSLFANDFGDLFGVINGQGDWDEGEYWVRRIQDFCESRDIICLVVPAPFASQVEYQRQGASYPGQASNFAGKNTLNYLDPIESFVDAQIEFRIRAAREQVPFSPSPLFNGRIGDGHFSTLGSKVWAEAVGARIVRLIELQDANRRPKSL